MVIQIDKNVKPEAIREMLKKNPRKQTLRPFVGSLKRGLDGLAYQKEARADEQ